MAFHTRSALFKIAVVAILAVLMLIPLGLLRSLVGERNQMRDFAFEQVANGWGGSQLIGGALIAIPVTSNDEFGKPITKTWYVLPESLDIEAQMTVQDERRTIGIYEVPVYLTKLQMAVEFDVARQVARLMRSDPTAVVQLTSARLFVPVDDPRGLRDITLSDANWVNSALEPVTGASLRGLAAPILPDAGIDTGKRSLKLSMELAGTRSLAFLPMARQVQAHVTGNWPHPGFTRGFLPTQRSVTAQGFEGRWRILDLNRPYGGAWFTEEAPRSVLDSTAFGVDVVQPADLYQRVERSVKYGGLFVSLSFLTLFVWERLARRPVHPIQYALIGVSLSVFYLLLLALAEQIGFALAYGSAAGALCVLLGIYLAGAFRSNRAGVGAAGLFGSIFGLLYLLVTSEDYSLLTGSLVLFAMVAAAMLLTRNLDWYATDRISDGAAAET
jgi:inner membrane protein